jgi:hypothetical protein
VEQLQECLMANLWHSKNRKIIRDMADNVAQVSKFSTHMLMQSS